MPIWMPRYRILMYCFAAVPQVQIDIALKRIAELRKLSADGENPCTPASPLCQVRSHVCVVLASADGVR